MRRPCAVCGRVRLTTRTDVRPCCNDYLTTDVPEGECPFCAPDEKCALHVATAGFRTPAG